MGSAGSPNEKFRIAIVGSGPIGKLLAASATPHPRIEFVQYEAEELPLRPSFGYGIGPQTLHAAKVANPDFGQRLYDLCFLSRTWMRWWHGGAEDRLIANVEVPEGSVYGRLGREELLDLLDESMPDGVKANIHHGVTLVDIKQEGPGKLGLAFQDGINDTTVNAIWGCDGIRSLCRKTVQSSDFRPPVYTGMLAFRGKVPAEKVRAQVGDVFAEESHCFIGVKGWHVLTFPIGSGKLTNIAAFCVEPEWKKLGRDHVVTAEEALSYFPGRNQKVEAMLQLMLSDTVGGCQRLELTHLGQLGSFTNPELLITTFGDAANSMTPHIAGSMSTGIIGSTTFLLEWNSRIRRLPADASDEEIAKAFNEASAVYEAKHRPLAQKLVNLSLEQGPLWSGGIVDVDTLRERPLFLWQSADFLKPE